MRLHTEMRANLLKVYLFSFFWMFLILIPVLVPFFQSHGLSMQEVFQLQAIYALGVMIFEIPTGYLCDHWGRKRTLLTGAVLNGLGFSLLLKASTFWHFALFEAVLSAANSLISGADISLILDSLDHIKDPIEDRGAISSHRTHALANLQLAQVSGEAVASVLGGFLAALSFRYAVWAGVVAAWIPLFVALSFEEPRYEKMPARGHWQNLVEVSRFVLGRPGLSRWVFLNLITWGLSTFMAVWLFQKYWEYRGIPLAWFGALWAVLNFSVGVMGKLVHRIQAARGPRPLLLFLSVAPIVGYFGMATLPGLVGVAFALPFYLSRGCTQVLLREAFNREIPSRFRATANSLQTGTWRLGFAVFGPLVGFSVDHQGIVHTLFCLGAAFALLFFVVIPPLVRELSLVPSVPTTAEG